MVSGLPAKSVKDIRGTVGFSLLAKSEQRKAVALDFQFLSHQFHDNRMRFGGRAAGIDDMYTVWFAGSNCQISVPDAPKKSPAFLLKPVFVFSRALLCPRTFVFPVATPGAFDAECQVVVQQDRKVGLQVSAEDFVHLQYRLRTQLAPSPLVGFG